MQTLSSGEEKGCILISIFDKKKKKKKTNKQTNKQTFFLKKKE
jgi:hypothetical protein